MPNVTAYVDRAEGYARTMFRGMTDKGGAPYIGHLARVARRVNDDPVAEATAWLHDVLEDTAATTVDLVDLAMPRTVIDAVLLLTRDDDSGAYLDYIETIARSKGTAAAVARRVKIADLCDNLDPSRTAASASLRARYQRALDRLLHGDEVF